MGGTCSTDGRDEKCIRRTTFWLENVKGRDHWEDLGKDGKTLEWTLGKQVGKVWTGCNWLRLGTSGGLL